MKIKLLSLLTLFILIAQITFAQSGTNDATFNPTDVGFGNGDGFDIGPYALALQPDGKIIAGGFFTSFNGIVRNRIARLNSDGTFDPSFNMGTGFSAEVSTLAIQSDGKIIAGGKFASFNAVIREGIARLNSDGTLDASFNTGMGFGLSDYVNSVALQPDGKIIVGGEFTFFNGTSRERILRLDTDGNIDASFNPGTGFNGEVSTVSLQPDGKIIVGGTFTSFNGVTSNRIVRLNSNGTLDASYNIGTGFDNWVSSLILQPDGKIIVGGTFTAFNGTARNRIVRINSDGSIDAGFDPGTGFSNAVHSLALQSDGKIMVGGVFTTFNGTIRYNVARLNSDGTLDISFNIPSGSFMTARSFAIQPDGKIITGGSVSNIVRINTDGTFDPIFNAQTGFNGKVESMALQSDGKIIVGGTFTYFNGIERKRIARLNVDGTLDLTFNPGTGFSSDVYIVVLQSDGQIVVGGNFTSYNGTTSNRIARLNVNGSIDLSFFTGSGFNNAVNSVALQSDGRIIAGGNFTSFNGIAKTYIARLNTNGSIDGTFNIGTGFNAKVSAVALQADGKIIAGGEFTSYNGTAKNYIARLNTDGTLDATFNPTGFSSWVYLITIQPDGKIIVGGLFGGRIERLNANGTDDSSFGAGTGPSNRPYSITLRPDGKIIVGGDFTSFNGTAMNNIAGLNANGSLDAGFNTGSGFNSKVKSVVIQPDKKVILGGEFISFNGIGRNRIARLLAPACPTIVSTIQGSRCGTGTVNLQATASAGVLSWYAAISGGASLGTGSSFPTPSISATTTYYVEATYDGCTSPRTAVVATIKNSTASSTTQASCYNYIWNGTTYTTSGTYTKIIPNNAGCDSVMTLNLTIKNSTTSSTTLASCYNYTWNGTTYTSSGTYNKTIPNNAGCDSVMTLNLTINNSSSSTATISSCNNYTWNGTTYTSSGTYSKTIPNAAGCDSVMTLNLTIGTTATVTINKTSCNSYTWRGTTYTSTGVYTKNVTGGTCDSTLTLNLVINYSNTSNENQTSCDYYTWNGTTYTSSGTYTKTIPNKAGCDSVMTLNLIIKNGTSSATNQTACVSFIWNGTTYTSSGAYTKTIVNSKGCDSLMTLNLTINNTTNSVSTATACNNYTWNGTIYTSSGSYNKTIPNANGCDSLMTLNLTIKQNTSSTESQTACISYIWNGTTFNTSGTYTQTIPNAVGCDSLMTLNLTINNIPAITGTTPGSNCGAAAITLSALSDGGTLDWFAASSGGTSIGTGATFITPVLSATTTYYVDATGTCGTSPRTAVIASINNPLGSIGSISGSATVCSGSTNTYSVIPVADALSYTWTLPSGWIGSTGTSNSIITTAGSSGGDITVKANNACGSTSPQTLAVDVKTVDASVTQNGKTLVANALTGTFQWVDCNNSFAAIPGATQHSFTPTANGNYALVATKNGCSATSNCFTINPSSVGISEASFANSFKVYPNPTSKNISIDFGKDQKEVSIEIRNLVGQLIQEKKIENSSLLTIEISESTGIYFIHISDNLGHSTVKKIIKN